MKIFLIYGGKSAEHDISILTAYSIIKEVYYDYYEVEPVYITRDGRMDKRRSPLTRQKPFNFLKLYV